MTRTTSAERFAQAVERPEAVPTEAAVAGLVAIAAGLRAVPPPVPAFREALRARLVAEAAQVLPPATADAPTGADGPLRPADPSPAGPAPASAPVSAPAPAPAAVPASAPAAAPAGGPAVTPPVPAVSVPSALPWTVGPLAPALTGVLAAVVAVAGTGLAAHRSLPGDPLYGLKRRVEALRSRLPGGDAETATRARLDELGALVGGDRGLVPDGRVTAALAALHAELDRAIARLLAATVDGSAAARAELDALLTRTRSELAPLLGGLDPAAYARAVAVLERVAAAEVRLARLPVPGVGPTPGRTPVPTSRPTLPSVGPSRPPGSPVPQPSDPLPLPTPLLPTRSVPIPSIGD